MVSQGKLGQSPINTVQWKSSKFIKALLKTYKISAHDATARDLMRFRVRDHVSNGKYSKTQNFSCKATAVKSVIQEATIYIHNAS